MEGDYDAARKRWDAAIGALVDAALRNKQRSIEIAALSTIMAEAIGYLFACGPRDEAQQNEMVVLAKKLIDRGLSDGRALWAVRIAQKESRERH